MEENKNINTSVEAEPKKRRLTVCGVTGFTFSLATIIFVILSFFYVYLSTVAVALSLSAIIVSSIGVHLSKKNKKEGKDFSNFGMSAGVILLVVSLMMFVLFITTAI